MTDPTPPPTDEPPKRRFLGMPLIEWAILGAFAIAFAQFGIGQWMDREHPDLDRGELVHTLQHDGHTYALYFHRGGRYFNTIRKDGRLVFDSRTEPELRGCLHEMIVVDGQLLRRCYLPRKNEIVSAPLP